MRCYACGHCCPIPDGQPGVCKVASTAAATLYVPWGYVGGVQCDPIEKKPFFHAYPGALAYSFGMLGCDLHCALLPELGHVAGAARPARGRAAARSVTPEALVRDALRQGARVLVSTYNEPLITSEWAVAVFKEAKAAGLVTGFVSNGNGTPQVLDYLRPWVDLYKVDLKSFDDRHYRQLGGRLQPILDTIRSLHAMGFWLEIVTLLIPGFNDSDDELTRPDGIRRQRFARHSVARDRVPPGLQDDRPRRHARRRTCCAPRRSASGGPALRVCGQSSRPGRRSRRHALSPLRRRR